MGGVFHKRFLLFCAVWPLPVPAWYLGPANEQQCFSFAPRHQHSNEHTNAERNSTRLVGVVPNYFVSGLGALFRFLFETAASNLRRFNRASQALTELMGLFANDFGGVLEQVLRVSYDPFEIGYQFTSLCISSHNVPFI
jgi:hypothetical protein